MSRRRCGTRTDGYPPVTRRQRRRRALPASRRRRPGGRRTALRAPPRVGRGSVRQRRHQRPATTGTPFAPPLADVPPSAALGAHLDHRTSLAPATTRAAARGAVRSRAIQPRSGDDARCGTRRGEELRRRSGNTNSCLWLSTVSTGLSTASAWVCTASTLPLPVDLGCRVDKRGLVQACHIHPRSVCERNDLPH
jgi:hypothetical protein